MKNRNKVYTRFVRIPQRCILIAIACVCVVYLGVAIFAMQEVEIVIQDQYQFSSISFIEENDVELDADFYTAIHSVSFSNCNKIVLYSDTTEKRIEKSRRQTVTLRGKYADKNEQSGFIAGMSLPRIVESWNSGDATDDHVRIPDRCARRLFVKPREHVVRVRNSEDISCEIKLNLMIDSETPLQIAVNGTPLKGAASPDKVSAICGADSEIAFTLKKKHANELSIWRDSIDAYAFNGQLANPKVIQMTPESQCNLSGDLSVNAVGKDTFQINNVVLSDLIFNVELNTANGGPATYKDSNHSCRQALWGSKTNNIIALASLVLSLVGLIPTRKKVTS
ncbi:MAG: hypothetical protein JXR76_24425 [Deltaproteobacteria bacterium]|nr:hypothetical protein [Deltaproteobacteria bacterium]